MSVTTTEPQLLAQLRDPDPHKRQLALVELEDTVAPELLEPLTLATGDADRTVRKLALGLLEELGDARALPFMIRALEDHEPEVREAAATALRDVRAEGGLTFL